jgi:hypothetical protein
MGQTKITGHSDCLMRKNGEKYVVDFMCGELSSFYTREVIVFCINAPESVGLPWSMCGYGA